MKHISLKQLQIDRADLEQQLMQAQQQMVLIQGALSYISQKIKACEEKSAENKEE